MGQTLLSLMQIAWRNLWRNHRRTGIMLAAISVGVWAMIFMTALMRGMIHNMVEDGIRALPGEIQIHHPDFLDDPSIVNSMPYPSDALRIILTSEQVSHWSARVRVPAVISSERENRGVTAIGLSPDKEVAARFFDNKIIAGRFINSEQDSGIVIGKRLAEKLETRLGKRIVLMSQDEDNNVADRGFRIVGIYAAALPAQEEQFVYIGKSTLQKMLSMDDQISEIALNGAGDYRELNLLLEELRRAEPNYTITPWQSLDSYLATMINVMDGFVLVWVIVVFLALSFGLVNTLAMAIFERTREIGLMMALGMRSFHIVFQILIESLFLLLLGLLIGNVAALLTIKPLESGIDISVVAEGMAMMGASSMLYPLLLIKDMLLANTVVILLGTLTSTLPAWRAARLDPIKALTKN